MKRVSSVLLSTLLSVSLVGCGSSTSSTTTTAESSAEAEETAEIIEAAEETPEVVEEIGYENMSMPYPIEEPDVLYRPYEEVKEYVDQLSDAIYAGQSQNMDGVSAALIGTGLNDTLYNNDIGNQLHTEATEYIGFWTIDENETYIRYQYHKSNGAVSYYYDLDYRPKDGGTGFYYRATIDEDSADKTICLVVAGTSNYLLNGSFTEFYTSSEGDGTINYTSTVTGTLANEFYDGLIYKEAKWPNMDGKWENTEIMFDNGTPVADYYTDANGNTGTGHKTGVDGMGREVDELAPSYYPGMYPISRSVA